MILIFLFILILYQYAFFNGNSMKESLFGEKIRDDQNILAYAKKEIVEIVDYRLFMNKSFYLVKWKNWSLGFNTWESDEALEFCQEHILEFKNKKYFFNTHVNIMHLMLTRQVITQLFVQFRTSTGLSLPLTTLEEISVISNALGHGTENEQKMRKMCLKTYLTHLSLDFFRQRQDRSHFCSLFFVP